MLRTRVIPCLLLRGSSLVKTVRFRSPRYIGDPVNTVRIFNELEVDELALLDISATPEGRAPDITALGRIADECFMPLAYGGGIRDVVTAGQILQTGFEKVIVNSASLEHPELIRQLADRFGSQAVIASIDVKRNFVGRPYVVTRSATRSYPLDPVEWAAKLEALGAGEILLTSVDREGTWRGFDLPQLARVTAAVKLPVIAHGGAGEIGHIEAALRTGGASAVALGSMVVYQSKGMGVLVSFPDRVALARAIG